MVHDLIVVGAGPVGCLIARKVAEKGFDVLVLEEHKSIGAPVQCAGLVTERAMKIGGIGRDCIQQEIRGAKIMGPGPECLVLSNPKRKVLVIDREAFDKNMAENAEDAGAEIRRGMRVVDLRQNGEHGVVKTHNGNEHISLFIAGCDGPSSITRRNMSLPPPPLLLMGVEVNAKVNQNKDLVVLRSSNKIAPGFFAWAIPLGDGMARIGLAVDPAKSSGNAKSYLMNIINKPSLLGLSKIDVKTWMAGAIPLSPPGRTSAGNILLAGDAACQVKSTSGGGVVMGLRCARHAARTIVRELENGPAGGSNLENYDKAWKKDIGRELRRDWALHSYHASMSDAQQAKALRLLSKPKTRDMINRLGDIDYPSKLVAPLLWGNPSLLFMLPGLARRYLFP